VEKPLTEAAGVSQEGERKRTIDDVSLSLGDIKIGALMLSWDKPEGCLFTALAVSGMKVARAWLGLCNGTGELLDTIRFFR
jgi:hypothetical protein